MAIRKRNNRSYDKVNELFLKCKRKDCTFETLLDCLMPYFRTVAANNPDPCEAVSRMSVALIKLIDAYDETKGKPMGLIRTMAKWKAIDVYKKYKTESLIVNSELIASHEGNEAHRFCCSRIDYGEDDYTNISAGIDEVLEQAEYLTELQQSKLFGGTCPALIDDKMECLRADLMANKDVRDWYDR
jgi:hypothetical protein